MEGQPQTKPVRIFRPKANLFLVEQELIRVHPGDSVQFAYEGNDGAVLFFPKIGVFPERVYDISGSTLKVTVQQDAPLGEFAYAIYCRDIDNFALAGSPPKMIIENP